MRKNNHRHARDIDQEALKNQSNGFLVKLLPEASSSAELTELK